MRVSSAKRRPKGAKRMDLTDMREALRDGRQWAAMGVVFKPSDRPAHYTILSKGGVNVDVLVEVAIMPMGGDLTCRLATGAGGAGAGLWRVPAVGDEVAVIIPEGATDFMPTIVAVLGSRLIPPSVAVNKTVLVAPDLIQVIAPEVDLGVAGGALQGVGLGQVIHDQLEALRVWIADINSHASFTTPPLATLAVLSTPTTASASVKATP